MKKLDIEQAEPIRKKFAPDWEIRKGTYLYKKVAFDDYNQVLRFLMAIEKPQIKLDHFADFMNFYNELTIAITTHDVKGLTQLDFELALYIDEALNLMDARQLEEAWSEKYKRSINCNNPKGFSQRAHCQGRKKNEDIDENFAEDKEIGIHRSSEDFAVIDLSKSADGTFWLNGVDNTDWDSTVTTGQGVDMAFEISPQAKLASYDDIDKYSIDELENMGYDGVRMVDGDNIAYQIWNTKILKRTKLGENFADGKVKGKSRPGRVKRAGASCNGSVTDLRKRAKNASGEKAKMYHWCANMKSGKKK